MALYTQGSIDRVKQAIDIVDLVGARTELRHVGTRFTGLCPFHDERTPSFSVNAELSLFHCFGCGESGDAIGFVEKTEALDFRESIEYLAERYGIELELEDEDAEAAELRRRREHLLGLLERATEFYARYLWKAEEGKSARAYLAERGLEQATLERFRVGYSPTAWDRLVTAAAADGFDRDELVQVGLAQSTRTGGFIDRFHGRIMFPLGDVRGRVLGFGARAHADDRPPKYLNTSENDIYHKGRLLFGIDLARAAAAKAGRIVVVEGYTDVLGLNQVGVVETVAIMGTSLTEEQMAELARAANTIYLALDADRAGQDAMLRAARMASSRDVELRVVTLPDGLDPAEFAVERGVEAVEEAIAVALTVPEFAVRRALEAANLDSPQGRDAALEAVRPLVAVVAERSASRDELVRRVADRLDMEASYVVSKLAAAGASRAGQGRMPVDGLGAVGGSVGPGWPGRRGEARAGSEHGAALSPAEVAARAERSFLAMCLGQRGTGKPYLERLTDDHLTSEPLRRLRAHLAAHPDDPVGAIPQDDPELLAAAREVVMRAEDDPSSAAAVSLSFLELDLRRIERALRGLRGEGDLAGQSRLFAERERVRAEMDAVMGAVL